MPKKMIELTPKQCKAVSGGSGYLIASGRTGQAGSGGGTDTTTTSSTDRSGYILAGN
jgi:hypothetical protein